MPGGRPSPYDAPVTVPAPLPWPAACGFVGTGAITAAIVEGLHVDAAHPPAVFLSPRSRSVSQELAGRFPHVQVCDGNQDVLESATAIVVAVRPQVASAVLEELSFRPDHVVMSVVAGVQLEQLRDWVAPAGHVVRVIPLPTAARARSLTTIFPDNTVARELFSRVGEVLVPTEESSFDALSASTGTFAAHLDYLSTIASWLADHGLDERTATTFVTRVFGQLGESLLQQTDSLATLVDRHMTPGGTNQQFMTDLRRDGVPDGVWRAPDRILDRLRG
jgi:pyrroline-5-carboxylate reductase